MTEYLATLQQFYGFYVPWEETLEPWLDASLGDSKEARRKLPALTRDLQYFGIDTANVSLCTATPPIRSLSEAWGSLYVREGAALGGRFIASHIERRFGLSEGKGYEFFSSKGRDVSGMWRKFQTLLTKHAPHCEEEGLIYSAKETFRCFHRWLAGGLS